MGGAGHILGGACRVRRSFNHRVAYFYCCKVITKKQQIRGDFSYFFSNIRGQQLNTNFFFSNFSGTAGMSQQNPGISRQKGLVSMVSRDIPNFSAPTPSRGRPPSHRRISGPKSLGLGSFFLPAICRSPRFGVGRKGSPRFVPICSDFPVFFRFVPIRAPCFREHPDLFRFAPFPSDLFRFVFRTIRTNQGIPFLPTPFANACNMASMGRWNSTER